MLSNLKQFVRTAMIFSRLIYFSDEVDICMAWILKVCADVFRAIDENTSFSIFKLATEARNQYPKIFQEIVSFFPKKIFAHEIFFTLLLVYPILYFGNCAFRNYFAKIYH